MKFILDTNVMVLLAVGTADEDLIERHKNTRSLKFNVEHYDKLIEIIGGFHNLAVTSNILTEASNLLDQTDTTKQLELRKIFAKIISAISEIHLPGKTIIDDPNFLRLGLTDALVLKLDKGQYHILSVDGPLCYACASMRLPHTNLTPVFFE